MATDNTSLLARANTRRHDAAVAATHDAIERLTRQAWSVNFAAVAHAAGVSRGWLHREPEIRDLIARLRGERPPTTNPVAQRASTDSLRQRLDTARAETTRLRADNTALRDQLARHLGAQRAKLADHEPNNSR
jgi:Family of unknown function (DUF6262)